MNRAEESAFAWALMDSADAFLGEGARTWLCVRIGAGEQERAIRQLLEGFAASGASLPSTLSGALWAWIRGFVGSDDETVLRDIGRRIRLSNSSYSELVSRPKFLMPCRNERNAGRSPLSPVEDGSTIPSAS